jgi:hypothetical protein
LFSNKKGLLQEFPETSRVFYGSPERRNNEQVKTTVFPETNAFWFLNKQILG